MTRGLLARLRQPPWLQKAIRTGLAVAPGLSWWAAKGDVHGISFAFAALCLSVPYGDAKARPRHIAAMALLAAVLLPGTTWLEARPLACVPSVMAAMVVFVTLRRRTKIPGTLVNWLTIFLLYEASELSPHGIDATLVPSLLVFPAAGWMILVCFVLWPGRGVSRTQAAKPSGVAMSVPRHVLCAVLAAGSAASVAFLLGSTHVNWAIWSAITVVQSGVQESLVKSGRRIAGGILGCTAGYAALLVLHGLPWLLGAVTAVLTVLMVAPETYVLAVSFRSALAILAATELYGDGAAAGLARIENIAIGVVLALAVILALSPGGVMRGRDAPRAA
ncbi:MAG TPA: FUSC family protein [Acetobacteraceae bacterium]|nr:FUSC family protein [Acetobacteraceae bacterium]